MKNSTNYITEKLNQTEICIDNQSNSWDKPVSNLISFPDSPESGYLSSPQYDGSQYYPPCQTRYIYQYKRAPRYNDYSLEKNTLYPTSLNDAPQVQPTTVERLANFVHSIPVVPPVNHDHLFVLTLPEKIKKKKSQAVKEKDNAQPLTQIPERSHLYTSSCGQIGIPFSLQQSTTFTTSAEKKYTTANKIPTNEQNTVNIENLKSKFEATVIDNCDKQLYQTNAVSANQSFKFHNLHPQQEQFHHSNKSSAVLLTIAQRTDLVKDTIFPDDIVETIAQLYNDYEPSIKVIPLNNEQEIGQEVQKFPKIKEPNCFQNPHTNTKVKSEGKEFVTSITTNNQVYPVYDPSIFFKLPSRYPEKNWRNSGENSASLPQHVAVANFSNTNISPTSNIVTEMKYETQSGPPTTPSHLTSSGVEPPHSSQASGIVMGDSPAEVVGVDSLLLSPWAANGPEFLEGGVPDVKQTAGFQDTSWVDSLMLSSTVNVASAQSLMEIKGPLPSFTNYTGHLSINGISGHHYHTIASSGQRSSVPSASPTPSSNQEYYESPVVSSSTPCPQVSQKHQPQNHQQPQQTQQHPHPQNQQLPQSTQQIEYDIDDIAEIIGSAIADTTVPGNGNGPSSEQTSDTSRDQWMDIDRIADWIGMPECSPKTQETTSPNSYAPQIYVTTTPTMPTQQHAGSTLQNLLTQNYAPLLQARLQAGNTAGLQNASCGETPSSTSPYPPLSPPNRVSTSCSPDDLLHSSFATPSHPRKRSRSSGSGQSQNKKNPAVNAAVLPYGAESEVVGNGPKKPVHRCQMCNRAFLNKSNIKVHLRTHTGEKPFKCDVCSKAFRQKAHLIKHQQIHKRGGRE
ncbi:uncharacterized protein Ich [Anoplolepis gracilipes]|uniref:uncharacterized protein Ich n=1 Tax=Anoplolepis gracilipes TaxID=354296 RepID=UPI003BA33F85